MNIIKELPFNPHWKPRTEGTKWLVLHHADAEKCSIQDIDSWHYKNGWNGGCGYHFFIRKNGLIYEGRPIDIVGAHCIGYNETSIGICFEGNFNLENMTQEQINSGINLIRFVRSKYQGIRVMRHLDFNKTSCPGINFNNEIIYEGMKNEEIKDDGFDDILEVLASYTTTDGKQLLDKNYWSKNAIAGGTCKGEYVRILIKNLYEKMRL